MDIPQGLHDHITTKLILINELSAINQEKLLESAVIETYESGSYIFEQGEENNYVYYLLVGKLNMMAMEETTFVIDADSSQSCYPLSQMQPRQYSAHVIHVAQALKVSKSLLESLLESEKKGQSSQPDEIESDDDMVSGYDWMTHLLQSKIFSNIPPQNIQKIFALFQEVAVSKDDIIIKQGASGDYFYIIKDGEFEVSRNLDKQDKTFKLATLHDGDGFGEEALLGDVPRNASVIAMTDGTLMRITKQAFLSLIRDPAIDTVNYEKALQMINDGATWIDVRFPDEHKRSALTGSLNFPLDMIRVQMKKLNPESNYVVYCDNGTRSAIAAYLLLNNGYTVSYLQDGVNDHLEQPIIESKINEQKPSEKGTQISKQDEQELQVNKVVTESESSVSADTEALVQAILSQQSDMEELSKALSTVLENVFKSLEQALKEKAEAEIARNIIEQKLKIFQKQKK